MHDNTPDHDTAKQKRYIETDYKVCLLAKLQPLPAMAEQVESIHYGEEDVPEGLSDLLHQLFVEIEAHLKGQEASLFPAIRECGGSGLEDAMTVVRAEHDRHAAVISGIRSLTGEMMTPEGACRTWKALYADLAEFIVNLEQYVQLENEVLFARFEARI